MHWFGLRPAPVDAPAAPAAPAPPDLWCDWCNLVYTGPACPCCHGTMDACAHTALAPEAGPAGGVPGGWAPPAGLDEAAAALARDGAAVAAHCRTLLPPGPVREEALRHLDIVLALAASGLPRAEGSPPC